VAVLERFLDYLRKEIEYLRRELELRDEKLVEQLSRQIEAHLGGTRPRPKRRVLPDKDVE
jgi:hypothetical protein